MDSEQPGQPADDTSDQGDAEIDRYLDRIRSNSLAWLDGYKARRIELEQAIYANGAQAFDAFDLLVIICQRTVTAINAQTRHSPGTPNDVMQQALFPLAARACQIAKEVRVLLGAGYAAGATTRWRALHELHVVARIIEIHRAPLAKRYLDHAVVEKYKLATATQQVYQDIGEPIPAPIADAIIDVRREYGKLQAQYSGDEAFFHKDYGWASSYVSAPDLVSLERAAGLTNRRSAYRIASGNVHPNIAGAFAGSISTDEGESLVLGPSEGGMEYAGISAGSALVEITRILLRYVLATLDISDDIKREWALTSLAFDPLLHDLLSAAQGLGDAINGAEHS